MMSLLPAVTALVADQAKQRARRMAAVAVLCVAAALSLIGAIGYGLHALQLQLADDVGPIYASLIVAGGMALIGLILLGIAMVVKQRRIQPTMRDNAMSVGVPVALGLAARRMPLVTLAIGAVALAGILLGAFSKRD